MENIVAQNEKFKKKWLRVYVLKQIKFYIFGNVGFFYRPTSIVCQ